MEPKCLHCGSAELLSDVAVLDRGHGDRRLRLTLETCENPEAFLFKGARQAEVSAKVCERCGFVMLFAQPSDVEELKVSRGKTEG